MKHFFPSFTILSSVFVLAFIITCCVMNTFSTRTLYTAQPQVIMEVMDPSLEQYAGLWQKEIGRRFPNAVGILCHGGEFINDEWLVKVDSFTRPAMTADQLVQHFQDKYPGRTIVLLACNPGHLHLHERGVFHATDSVWCVPDRFIQSHEEDSLAKLEIEQIDRSEIMPDVVGNVWEFVAD